MPSSVRREQREAAWRAVVGEEPRGALVKQWIETGETSDALVHAVEIVHVVPLDLVARVAQAIADAVEAAREAPSGRVDRSLAAGYVWPDLQPTDYGPSLTRWIATGEGHETLQVREVAGLLGLRAELERRAILDAGGGWSILSALRVLLLERRTDAADPARETARRWLKQIDQGGRAVDYPGPPLRDAYERAWGVWWRGSPSRQLAGDWCGDEHERPMTLDECREWLRSPCTSPGEGYEIRRYPPSDDQGGSSG